MGTFQIKAYITISVPYDDTADAEANFDLDMNTAQNALICTVQKLVDDNEWDLDNFEIK